MVTIGSVIICIIVLKSKNVYGHCMSTTVTLCYDNGLQLNPAIVNVDFEQAAMKVLKEIFWNVSIKCYRILSCPGMMGTNTESRFKSGIQKI